MTCDSVYNSRRLIPTSLTIELDLI